MPTPAAEGPGPIRARGSSLGRETAERLRARIVSGEFAEGSRLPSETSIAETYGVSRVTVRTALKLLESQGLVTIRHGSGTYVAEFGGQVRTGLQELRSMTETIRELGFEPSIERHRLEHRPCSELEAQRLGIEEGDEVIAFERAILGDDTVMAYSYDVIPASLIPKERVGELGEGSVFAVLDSLGHQPVRALAEVHAVSSLDIGWGDRRPEDGIYVLLDQVHQTLSGSSIAYSRTYFVEGRFQFTILRTR